MNDLATDLSFGGIHGGSVRVRRRKRNCVVEQTYGDRASDDCNISLNIVGHKRIIESWKKEMFSC